LLLRARLGGGLDHARRHGAVPAALLAGRKKIRHCRRRRQRIADAESYPSRNGGGWRAQRAGRGMISLPMIRIRNLCMTYRGGGAGQAAVTGVSLDVTEGAFYTLLGPSGCGKTTTLRCVAGLERPDAGEIAIGGEVVCAPGIWVEPHH